MNKSVLAMMLLSLLAISGNALARKDPANFANHKEKVLERISKNHGCFSAAQDSNQLLACLPNKEKTAAKKEIANFDNYKQKLIERNQERQTCVTGAQTKEEIKTCLQSKKANKAAAQPAVDAPMAQ